jgi:hypothetical protein
MAFMEGIVAAGSTATQVAGADLTPGNFNGTFPSGINLFGAITGHYIDLNGVGHGFVAVPCDHGCSKNGGAVMAATARVSTATVTNQVVPALPGMLNPKLRLDALVTPRSCRENPAELMGRG